MSALYRRLEAAKARRSNAAAAGGPSALSERPTNIQGMLLRDPNDLVLNSRLEQGVLQLRESYRPSNTSKAQDPKEEEYMQFCDALYPHDVHRHVLNADRVYRFIIFQAFREKRRRGGRRGLGDQANFFDLDAYNTVMDSTGGTTGNVVEFPSPAKPTGPAVFNAYKAVIRKIYKKQIAQRVLSEHWDRIWTQAFDELHKHIKERAPIVKKLTYQEKVSGAFAPYTIVEYYDKIEEALYEDGISGGSRHVGSALRNRYALLHLTSGILRCESLYRAELSDFLGIFAILSTSGTLQFGHPEVLIENTAIYSQSRCI